MSERREGERGFRGAHAARVASTVAALVLAMAGPTSASELIDPLGEGLTQRERLDALVQQVKVAQSDIQTMRSEFERRQTSELLLEPEVSRGRFSYSAPDRVRWEYREPHPIDTLIEGETMITYYADLAKAERYAIGQYSERVFEYLGARGSLETLMNYFELTAEFPEAAGDPYHLILLPRYKRVKKRLDSMELWIDPDKFLPIQLRYVLPGGDSTEFKFEDLKINGDLDDSSFQLDLPAEVEIRSVDLKGRG